MVAVELLLDVAVFCAGPVAGVIPDPIDPFKDSDANEPSLLSGAMIDNVCP
jgi:hypothetical protein